MLHARLTAASRRPRAFAQIPGLDIWITDIVVVKQTGQAGCWPTVDIQTSFHSFLLLLVHLKLESKWTQGLKVAPIQSLIVLTVIQSIWEFILVAVHPLSIAQRQFCSLTNGKYHFYCTKCKKYSIYLPKQTNNTSLVWIDAETAGTAKTTFGRERFEGGAPLIKRDKHQTADWQVMGSKAGWKASLIYKEGNR